MPVARLDEQTVEQRPLVGRHAIAHRRVVGSFDVEMVGGAEERSQLERRHLGQSWPIDVVAGDGSPLVQLEP